MTTKTYSVLEITVYNLYIYIYIFCDSESSRPALVHHGADVFHGNRFAVHANDRQHPRDDRRLGDDLQIDIGRGVRLQTTALLVQLAGSLAVD